MISSTSGLAFLAAALPDPVAFLFTLGLPPLFLVPCPLLPRVFFFRAGSLVLRLKNTSQIICYNAIFSQFDLVFSYYSTPKYSIATPFKLTNERYSTPSSRQLLCHFTLEGRRTSALQWVLRIENPRETKTLSFDAFLSYSTWSTIFGHIFAEPTVSAVRIVQACITFTTPITTTHPSVRLALVTL